MKFFGTTWKVTESETVEIIKNITVKETENVTEQEVEEVVRSTNGTEAPGAEETEAATEAPANVTEAATEAPKKLCKHQKDETECQAHSKNCRWKADTKKCMLAVRLTLWCVKEKCVSGRGFEKICSEF